MKSDDKKMLNLAEKILKNFEVHYQKEIQDEIACLRFKIAIQNSIGCVESVIWINDGGINFSSWISPGAGERKPEVTEYLCRVNSGLATGCFSLDWDEGAITCRALGMCTDVLDEKIVDDRMFYPIDCFEKYGDGLMKVIMGLASPKEAYDQTVAELNAEE